ncbi:hypothetical protein D3C73_1292440 [compost metagenome]
MFALSRQGQDDRGHGHVDPEAVGNECQDGQNEPQIASTGEVVGWDQVACGPACHVKNDTGKNQDDD